MKRIMFLCLGFAVAYCVNAQSAEKKIPSINESKLVKQITELLNHAKTNFTAIKGEPDKELNKKYEPVNSTYYKSSLKPDGSIETYIEIGENPKKFEFKSYFAKDLSSYSKEPDLFYKKLAELIKEKFKEDEFEITEEHYQSMLGDIYQELRLQRKGDTTHYLQLTLSEIDNTEQILKNVYIVIK